MVGHEDFYEVSDLGRMRSWRNGRWGRAETPTLMQPTLNHGYPQTNLRKAGKDVSVQVHRAVALTFLGPAPEEGMQVAHLNGKADDPRLVNLKWTTPVENNSHKRLHGTHRCGSRIPAAKLTERDVVRIRERIASGERQDTIAAYYQVDRAQISRIKHGTTWAHVA